MRLFLTILIFVTSNVFAGESDPEAATRMYFEKLQTDGLTAAADLMHPDELEKFKRMLLPVYEAESSSGRSDFRAATFGSLATIMDVRGASGKDFMQAILKLVASQGNAAGGIKFDAVDVLGSVSEGNDIVHVVARTTVGVGEIKTSKLEVVSWRSYKDEWRTMLSGEFEGLAQQLQRQLGQ